LDDSLNSPQGGKVAPEQSTIVSSHEERQ
jgi:hypothetical protein